MPNMARSDAREAAPPSYTEQVERDPRAIGSPRTERESVSDGSVSGQNSEDNREDSLSEPGTVIQRDQGLGGISTSSGNTAITETVVIERNATRSQNARTALDREIVETIRGIAREQQNLRTELTQGQRNLGAELAQEQRNLRSEIQSARQEQRNLRIEIQGVRQDTAELQATAKTHESRLGLVFKRIGDVIDDQWAVREGMEELRKTYETRVPARSPIKSELRSTNNGGDRSSTPVPAAMPRSDIESLYAAEEDNQEVVPEDAIGQPEAESQRQNRGETPGEAWIQTRDQPQRFGLGTEEALERWRVASEASREQRAVRRLRKNGTQQRREVGTRSTEDRGEGGEQRRSVTQPHEVGFGRHPNPSTPPQRNPQPSNHGHQDPGDGSSSGDEPRRGGGGPNHPPRRRPSHAGGDSQDGIQTSRGRSRRQRRGSPSNSSSPGTSEDWDSEFTVLEDNDRRRREKRDHRRDPRAEYEREQLRGIRERIRKMVGQDIQYAPSYKGVKDMVTIAKYSGQNDNGVFTRWLDHLLMYFQLNRMCGPDNELVRLSAMYNSLEGVAQEWYRDLILHTPKRSWTFEKAACSLFLTYVFGSAASHAAREFSEVKYSRTEGARKYAQRLKTKARRLARKPDESTMIVRFLAGLPGDVSRRLTLRERLDPTRHRLKQFVSTLHELEEAENVTKTVNAAVVEEQRKTDAQEPRKMNRPQLGGKDRTYKAQRLSAPQQDRQRLGERKTDDRLVKGKGPAKDVTCFRCQGKGHYSNDPGCPMFEKNGGQSRQLRDRPQLKAARISDVDDKASMADESSEELDGKGDWDDGSQWDSAAEGEGSLHSHEGDPQINKMSAEITASETGEDDAVYVRAMRNKVVSIQRENPARAAMNSKIDRPRRSRAYESCLATYVEINGMEAFTLFDSGSSADAISPDFAQISDTRIHTLDKPVPLQLGTVGSRASINYGVKTSVGFGNRTEEKYYLDVVNIDRYDAILGAPFMRRFGIHLDFESNSIIVGDMTIRALLPEEEATLLRGRNIRRNSGESRQAR